MGGLFVELQLKQQQSKKAKSLLLCSLPSSLSVLIHNECRSHIYALAEKAYSSLIATGLNQAGFHHQRRKWCRQDREHEGYLQGPGEPQERALQRPANVNMILEAFRQCFLLFHNSSCFVRTSFPTLSLFFLFLLLFLIDSFLPSFLSCFSFDFTLQGKFTELQLDDSGVLCGGREYDSICWRRRGLTAAFISSVLPILPRQAQSRADPQPFVFKQLQYSAMLKTVRIRRQGSLVRFAFFTLLAAFNTNNDNKRS